MINVKKGTTIRPVRFKSKDAETQYECCLASKEQALEEIIDEIESGVQVTNLVSSKQKIESRKRLTLTKK